MLDEVSNLFNEMPNDAYIRENFILGLASKSPLDIPRKKYRKKQNIQKEEQKNKRPPINIRPPLIPISRSTWRRWVKAGTAPQPVKLSAGVVAWRVGDLRDWLKQKSNDYHDSKK